ncbi:MAG: hypothetical protein WDN06_18895 [Asticcacaulis sp.]
MKTRAVWLAGMAGLAVLTAAGLHNILPGMEKDIRARVDRVMAGHDDVKATVSGQTVTLTAMDADPDAAGKLAQAKAAVASIKSPDEPNVPGGQWLNGTVTHVEVIAPVVPSKPASDAVPAADAPPAVGRRKGDQHRYQRLQHAACGRRRWPAAVEGGIAGVRRKDLQSHGWPQAVLRARHLRPDAGQPAGARRRL